MAVGFCPVGFCPVGYCPSGVVCPSEVLSVPPPPYTHTINLEYISSFQLLSMCVLIRLNMVIPSDSAEINFEGSNCM